MSNWAHQQGPSQRQNDEYDRQDEPQQPQPPQPQLRHHQHQQQYPHQFSFQHRYYPYAQYRHYPHKYHNALPMMYHQNSSFPAASSPDAVPQYLLCSPGPGPGFSFYPGYQPPAAGASRQPSVASLQILQPLAPPRMKVKPEQQPALPSQPPTSAAAAAVAASPSTAPEDDEGARGAQGYVHKCHLCNKSFKRRSWLRRHLLSHSPARHFSCPWCLSKHKRKDNLLQHMKLKHTDYVLQELRLHHVHVASDAPTTNNIRTLLYEGRLNKDDVKKVLNSLIDSHNQ